MKGYKRMPEKDGQIYCYEHNRYEDKAGFYVCPSKERGFSNACKAGEAERKRSRPAVTVNGLNYNIFSPVNFL